MDKEWKNSSVRSIDQRIRWFTFTFCLNPMNGRMEKNWGWGRGNFNKQNEERRRRNTPDANLTLCSGCSLPSSYIVISERTKIPFHRKKQQYRFICIMEIHKRMCKHPK